MNNMMDLDACMQAHDLNMTPWYVNTRYEMVKIACTQSNDMKLNGT